MAAPDPWERLGNWLFRFRSFLPPLLLLVLIAALAESPGDDAGLDQPFVGLGIGLAVTGLAVRAWVTGTAPRGTSGRNTVEQVALELNTSGLYSVMQHPVYLGNLLIWVGLAAATGSWWAVIVTTVAFAGFYFPMVRAEEAFLRRRFEAVHAKWAEDTPRFIPRPSRWRPANLPLSFKMVLRQEYYGVFTVAFFFVVLELAATTIDTGRPRLGPPWVAGFASITVLAGVCRFLQRRTTVLEVPGR